MTVLSSLPESPSEPSCYHTIEALLGIMLPTEEEWDSHNKQLPNKVSLVPDLLIQPESPSEPKCYHTIGALLAIMLPTEEEYDSHNKQLPNKVGPGPCCL